MALKLRDTLKGPVSTKMARQGQADRTERGEPSTHRESNKKAATQGEVSPKRREANPQLNHQMHERLRGHFDPEHSEWKPMALVGHQHLSYGRVGRMPYTALPHTAYF
jgi:hypothetical protein